MKKNPKIKIVTKNILEKIERIENANSEYNQKYNNSFKEIDNKDKLILSSIEEIGINRDKFDEVIKEVSKHIKSLLSLSNKKLEEAKLIKAEK